jgi:hypothetical protein
MSAVFSIFKAGPGEFLETAAVQTTSRRQNNAKTAHPYAASRSPCYGHDHHNLKDRPWIVSSHHVAE